MGKPVAVAVGFIAKIPLAGMALYCLHHIVGLLELGYDVFYVERENYPGQCYDPRDNASTADPTYGLRYLEDALDRIGVDPKRYVFIDCNGRFHGFDVRAVKSVVEQAEFVLTMADPTWHDVLGDCPVRVFIDGNPLFIQCAMLDGKGPVAHAVANYDHLFTYGTRIGAADCSIPDAGRTWRPMRPVVATSLWQPAPVTLGAPITTVMNWSAAGQVECDGRVYGQKDWEFRRLIDLPNHVDRPLQIAVGGKAPKKDLKDHGWQLTNPIEATESLDAYHEFIASSWADLGICKHGYVASRSGWFSDRSTCYLGAGRPVLHQDTGFRDWLPAGPGILDFGDLGQLVECIKELEADYYIHATAARRVAQEHFEAADVIGGLLTDVGVRA